eukprot:5708331-Ditylum_brightwellii.AAC.1
MTPAPMSRWCFAARPLCGAILPCIFSGSLMATPVAISFCSCAGMKASSSVVILYPADSGVALYGALADSWSGSRNTSDIGLIQRIQPIGKIWWGGFAESFSTSSGSTDSSVWGVILALCAGIMVGALEDNFGVWSIEPDV